MSGDCAQVLALAPGSGCGSGHGLSLGFGLSFDGGLGGEGGNASILFPLASRSRDFRFLPATPLFFLLTGEDVLLGLDSGLAFFGLGFSMPFVSTCMLLGLSSPSFSSPCVAPAPSLLIHILLGFWSSSSSGAFGVEFPDVPLSCMAPAPLLSTHIPLGFWSSSSGGAFSVEFPDVPVSCLAPTPVMLVLIPLGFSSSCAALCVVFIADGGQALPCRLVAHRPVPPFACQRTS